MQFSHKLHGLHKRHKRWSNLFINWYVGYSIIFDRFFQCLCRPLLPGAYGHRQSGATWLSSHLRATPSPSGVRRGQEGPFPPPPLAPSRSGHPKHKTLVKPVFCCQLTYYQFLILLLEKAALSKYIFFYSFNFHFFKIGFPAFAESYKSILAIIWLESFFHAFCRPNGKAIKHVVTVSSSTGY